MRDHPCGLKWARVGTRWGATGASSSTKPHTEQPGTWIAPDDLRGAQIDRSKLFYRMQQP